MQRDKLNGYSEDAQLLRVWYRLNGGPQQFVLAFQLTAGSKERLMQFILQKAQDDALLKPGNLIIALPGSRGQALMTIAAEYKCKVRLIGAELMPSPSEVDYGTLLFSDLEQRYSIEAHTKTLGRDLGHQLLLHRIKPDAFVSGVRTGGTIKGVGKYLQVLYPEMVLQPLQNGNDAETIPMLEALHHLGMAVGLSSAANLVGAIKMQQQMPQGAVVVTIFPDIRKNDVMKAGKSTAQIELLRVEAIGKREEI